MQFGPRLVVIYKKTLDNFFKKLDNIPRLITIHIVSKFQGHRKQGRQLNWASNVTNFPPRFYVYEWASSLFTGIIFKFHVQVHKIKLH